MDKRKEIEERVKADAAYFWTDERARMMQADRAYLLSQLSAVTAERDRLREAAQPFVEAAKHVAIGFSDMDDIVYIDYDIFGGTTLSAGQLRALSAAAKVQP